jgi:PAS domain S-box-containing protein
LSALLHGDVLYRLIVETTSEGIWVLDADNRTMFANNALASMLGYTVEEMLGRPVFDFADDEGARAAAERLRQRRTGISERVAARYKRGDGTPLDAMLCANPLFGKDGEYVGALGIVSDMTERRSLEKQLRQSQKLEAIGQLAGGIAHDFNNLLLALRGYGELALRRIEGGDANVSDDIAEMLDATDRAASLTQQLLAFGRRQLLNPEVVDLCEVVAGMGKLLRRLIGEQVQLVTSCADGPVLVDVDRSQLEQVIANLVVNARDAMPDGGHLELGVAISGDGEAMLSVADTGCGMDDETTMHIFEPFFTTKGEKGNGLGLATVHGIVTQSGGHVSVMSALGQGSTFRVLLPLAKGEPTHAPVAQAAARGGTETILVIEDNSLVRSIVGAMLERRGYKVITVVGGEAAIERCQEFDEGIDLILSDLVMPGLNGRQTVERLRHIGCKAKVIYMSGYADGTLHRGVLEPGTAFLQKPFDKDTLARRVREVLDQVGA